MTHLGSYKGDQRQSYMIQYFLLPCQSHKPTARQYGSSSQLTGPDHNSPRSCAEPPSSWETPSSRALHPAPTPEQQEQHMMRYTFSNLWSPRERHLIFDVESIFQSKNYPFSFSFFHNWLRIMWQPLHLFFCVRFSSDLVNLVLCLNKLFYSTTNLWCLHLCCSHWAEQWQWTFVHEKNSTVGVGLPPAGVAPGHSCAAAPGLSGWPPRASGGRWVKCTGVKTGSSSDLISWPPHAGSHPSSPCQWAAEAAGRSSYALGRRMSRAS